MLRQQLQNIRHQSALHVVTRSKQRKAIHLPFPGIETSIRELQNQFNGTSDEQDHDNNSNNCGIYPGDSMILYGKSGAGKTYILSRILKDSIDQQLDIVYIDLEQQYGSTMGSATAAETAMATVAAMTGGRSDINQYQQHVHLFRPRTNSDLLGVIYGLEKWFYDRGGDISMNVSWVMIDGEWNMGDNYQQNQDLKRKLVEKLKSLQYHWPFVLITTYCNKMMVTDIGIQHQKQQQQHQEQQQQHVTRYGQEYMFECYKLNQSIGMKLVPPSSSNHAYSMENLVTIID